MNDGGNKPRSKYAGIEFPGREYVTLKQGEHSIAAIRKAILNRSQPGAIPLDGLAIITNPSDEKDIGYLNREIILVEGFMRSGEFAALHDYAKTDVRYYLHGLRVHRDILQKGKLPTVRDQLANYTIPPAPKSSLASLPFDPVEGEEADMMSAEDAFAAQKARYSGIDLASLETIELTEIQPSVPAIKKAIRWRSQPGSVPLKWLSISAPELQYHDIGFLKNEITDLEQYLETPEAKNLDATVIQDIRRFAERRRRNLIALTEEPLSLRTTKFDFSNSSSDRVKPDAGVRGVVGKILGGLARFGKRDGKK